MAKIPLTRFLADARNHPLPQGERVQRAKRRECAECSRREVCLSQHDGEFAKTRRLFCPTSQARRAKIFLFTKIGTRVYSLPSRPHEGRNASSRFVVRAAMDAHLPQDVRQGRVRSSRVVLIPRRWDQANRDDLLAMGARKPGTPGRARSSRKAIAQGVPDVSACLY